MTDQKADRPIRLRQLVTVVYETTYTREEALELLQLSGLDMAHVPDDPTNGQLAKILAVAANTESLTGYDELYTRLTDDAGDWVDTTDVGDWRAP